MRKSFAIGLLALALSAGVGFAQDAVSLGKAEAIEHCARCHSGLQTGKPTRRDKNHFVEFTQTKSHAEARALLVELLAEGHAGLPASTFSAAELDHLVAYIKSLKW